MTNPRYKILLRTLYGAVLNSRLSTSDLKFLTGELRHGRLSDELAYMVDRALEHLGASGEDEAEDSRVVEAERLIRRNKISKASLANIMSSLGIDITSSGESTRSMLSRFINEMTTSRVDKLMSILASQQTDDGFLSGIIDKRK